MTATNYILNVGDSVWHGSRYWKQDDLESHEIRGWNVEWFECRVVHLSPKRIEVRHPYLGSFQLNRREMERHGNQYHSRVHEYFFAEKPDIIGDYMGQLRLAR